MDTPFSQTMDLCCKNLLCLKNMPDERINKQIFKWMCEKSNLNCNQNTNGPVNAHPISCPSKAQNIQNLENIYGKEMTLTFNTHIPS